MLTGVSKTYYKSGAVEMEVNFTNDKKHGIEKWYYESGELKEEIQYD